MPFIFDATKGESPASVARKRAIAEQLMAGIGTPDTIGGGIAAMGHGIASGIHNRKADRAEAAGTEASSAKWDELVNALSAGGEGPDLPTLLSASDDQWMPDNRRDVVNALVKEKITPPDPIKELQRKKLEIEVRDLENPDAAGDYYGNLVPFQRQDGTWGYGQVNKSGDFKEVDLGEGNSALSTSKTINLENEQVITDRFGKVIDRLPVANKEAAKDTAIGKAQGEMAAQLPGKTAGITESIRLVDEILVHPSLNRAVGPIDGMVPSISAGARDFDERVTQLRGKAFLQARQDLRGGGQITDFEGQRAEAALVRASQAKGEDDFKAAMMEFREALTRGYDLLAQQAGEAAPAGTAKPVQDMSDAELEAIVNGQ